MFCRKQNKVSERRKFAKKKQIGSSADIMQKVENFLTTTGSSKRGAFSICLLVALLQNYNRVMVLTDLKKEFMTDKASFRAIIEQ